MSGILEKIPFVEGEEVTKGKTLYQIDPREYNAAVAEANASISKAKADIASAQANVDFAQTELDRLRKINSAVARYRTLPGRPPTWPRRKRLNRLLRLT